MKEYYQLKNNILFIILFSLFILIGAILLIFFDKRSILFFINSHNSNFLDKFFLFATYLGNGLFAATILIFFILINKNEALKLGISWAIVTVIVQLLKRVIFSGVMRPARILGAENLHIVDGVNIHLYHSFPSGHTATAFMIFSFLTIQVKKPFFDLIFFILALSVAYSRIYLAQHFFTDAYFGAIIGTLTVFTIFIFLEKKQKLHK